MCCKKLALNVSVLLLTFFFGFSGVELKQALLEPVAPKAAPKPTCTISTANNDAFARIPCEVDPQMSVAPQQDKYPNFESQNMDCAADELGYLQKKEENVRLWLQTNKKASKERTAKQKELAELKKQIELLNEKNSSESMSKVSKPTDLLYREKCFEKQQ